MHCTFALSLLLWAVAAYGKTDERAVLEKLHDVYLTRIRPVEHKFKYSDLGRGTVAENEIYTKPIVTVLRPGAASNAAFKLVLDDQEHHCHDDRTTIIEHGSFFEEHDADEKALSDALPISADDCDEGFRTMTSSADLLQTITLVDAPLSSRFLDKDYRRGCTDAVTSIFRKTDLFILVLNWNAMEVPKDMVKLFRKIDTSQTELIVVITDFKETVRPDVGEAYRAVLWMLQPFFPGGTAPELFFIPLDDDSQDDPLTRLQQGALQKKLWSLRDRQVNLKVNRIFRHARQIDEHIATLQRYLEAYITQNNELIRELTTEPNKFGILDECNAACQTAKDYQKFFRLNPIDEMTRLLDDCRNLQENAAFVERSFIEEFLPITTQSTETPAERAGKQEGAKAAVHHEVPPEGVPEPTFDASSKGFGEEKEKQEKSSKYRKKQGSGAKDTVKKSEQSHHSSKSEEHDEEPVRCVGPACPGYSQGPAAVETVRSPATRQAAAAIAESITDEENIKATDLEQEIETTDEDHADTDDVVDDDHDDDDDQDNVEDSSPEPPPSRTHRGVEGSIAEAKSDGKPFRKTEDQKPRMSSGQCKYRKNCDSAEAESQPFISDELWDMIPKSIREAVNLLPFDTEPFFEQAEQVLSMLPEISLGASGQGSEKAWCKFRARCRLALEKTGKVPKEFLKMMNQPPQHVHLSKKEEPRVSAKDKYRKSSAPGQPKVKKEREESKPKPQKGKYEKPPAVQKPAYAKDSHMDISDPRCKFHKKCHEKLKKLEHLEDKKADKMKKAPDSPQVQHAAKVRPYATAESDGKCRFRKSCRGKEAHVHIPAQQKVKEDRDHSTPRPVQSRPYLAGGTHKCEFARSCDKAAKEAAKLQRTAQKDTPKTVEPVSRPYVGDGSSGDCRFRKSCKGSTDQRHSKGQHDQKVPVKVEKKPKKDAKAAKDTMKAGEKDKPAKPTGVGRPYVGRPGKCAFKKSCSDNERRKEQQHRQQAVESISIPVVRPYTPGDAIERECRFMKSCKPAKKEPKSKAKHSDKKADVRIQAKPTARPYTGKHSHRDCRYMKSCSEKDIKHDAKRRQKESTEKPVKTPTPTKTRPYSTPQKDDKCRFRKSCTDEVKTKKDAKKDKHTEKEVPKKKEVPNVSRPYSGGSGKPQFMKSSAGQKKTYVKEKKPEKPSTKSEKPKPPVKRPYTDGSGKCEFKKSCSDKEKKLEQKRKQNDDSSKAPSVPAALRPYTDGSGKPQFMKSSTAQKKKLVKEKKSEKPSVTSEKPKKLVKRPYTDGSGKCQFQKSCVDKPKKGLSRVPQEKASVRGSPKAALAVRPYLGGTGKCQFRKSCTDKDRQQQEQLSASKVAKTSPAAVQRPYLTPLEKGEDCRFRKSCHGKPFKAVYVSSMPASRTASAAPVRQETGEVHVLEQQEGDSSEETRKIRDLGGDQSQKPVKTEKEAKKEKVEDKKAERSEKKRDKKPKKKPKKKKETSSEELDDEETMSQQLRATEQAVHTEVPEITVEEDSRGGGGEETSAEQPDEAAEVELATSEGANSSIDVDREHKEEQNVSSDHDSNNIPEDAGDDDDDDTTESLQMKSEQETPTREARPSGSAFPTSCKFRKNCATESEPDTHSGETKKSGSRPPVRPYTSGDGKQRECRFLKSCDKTKLSRPKDTKTEQRTGSPAVESRPYTSDAESRPCRFRKSCADQAHKPRTGAADVPSPSHQPSTPVKRDCRFRKDCKDSSDTSGQKVVTEADSQGSLLGGARDLAVQAVSRLFTPSRRHPPHSHGAGFNTEQLLQDKGLNARNRTVLERVMRQMLGVPPDTEYGCNIFHKGCRDALGMPPLKSGKVEKEKKKCRRKKKKKSV